MSEVICCLDSAKKKCTGPIGCHTAGPLPKGMVLESGRLFIGLYSIFMSPFKLGSTLYVCCRVFLIMRLLVSTILNTIPPYWWKTERTSENGVDFCS